MRPDINLALNGRGNIKGFFENIDSLVNKFSGNLVAHESNLIDIQPENFYTHSILLKSSKPDVNPLNIKIGNSILAAKRNAGQ